MRVLVAIALVAGIARPASATPKQSFIIGAGVGLSNLDAYSYENTTHYTTGLSLYNLVAWEIRPGFALGWRSGIVTVEGQASMFPRGDYRYWALDSAPTALLSVDRFWVAPWAGVSSLQGEADELRDAIENKVSFGYGVDLGATIVRFDQRRVDVHASAMQSMKEGPDVGKQFFRSLTFGVVYRI